MAMVHAEDEALELPASRSAKPRKTDRGSLPKHLPRIEEITAPDKMTCGCGNKRHVIREDTSERLDIIPAQRDLILAVAG
jgi:transposase